MRTLLCTRSCRFEPCYVRGHADSNLVMYAVTPMRTLLCARSRAQPGYPIRREAETVESNDVRAALARGPGQVALGSKPQLATAKTPRSRWQGYFLICTSYSHTYEANASSVSPCTSARLASYTSVS